MKEHEREQRAIKAEQSRLHLKNIKKNKNSSSISKTKKKSKNNSSSNNNRDSNNNNINHDPTSRERSPSDSPIPRSFGPSSGSKNKMRKKSVVAKSTGVGGATKLRFDFSKIAAARNKKSHLNNPNLTKPVDLSSLIPGPTPSAADAKISATTNLSSSFVPNKPVDLSIIMGTAGATGAASGGSVHARAGSASTLDYLNILSHKPAQE